MPSSSILEIEVPEEGIFYSVEGGGNYCAVQLNFEVFVFGSSFLSSTKRVISALVLDECCIVLNVVELLKY